ncbi:MAG: hypothetical protein EXR75_02390 [Myxococcales bacterium]|nr:hypothetical protein [Myxococcales bacterium]
MLLSVASVACDPEEAPPCEEASGVACVWAGKTGELGLNGDGKDRRDTLLYWPLDLSFAPDGTAWFLDWNNHMLRKVQPDGTVATAVGTFVGDGAPGGLDLEEPGAPGLDVSLNHPTDIVFRPDGALVFAAWHNHKIRKLDPETGNVVVIYGSGPGFVGDGGPSRTAKFNQPKALAYGDSGELYILDQRNFRVRRVSGDETATMGTAVGKGTAGFSGDGGPADAAELAFEAGGNPEPSGALLYAGGKLYVADALNHRIRVVDLATGLIATVAGNGKPGFSGDGKSALDASFNNVRDLELGPDGRLYVADTDNHVVRAIDLDTGVVETVVGTGTAGSKADGVTAREVELNRPFGLAFDASGALYIADTFNSRIVKVPR